MRTIPDNDRRELALGDIPSPLNVLLLYEDAPTALRAKYLVDQLVQHVNLIASFRLNLLRFDLLARFDLQWLQTDEALKADILLLSAHGQADLPPAIWAWLEHWLGSPAHQPRALVMSLDSRARDFGVASQIQYFAQTSASRAGVEVFTHFGDPGKRDLDAAIAGIQCRAETTSILLQETLHHAGSGAFRCWGINE